MQSDDFCVSIRNKGSRELNLNLTELLFHVGPTSPIHDETEKEGGRERKEAAAQQEIFLDPERQRHSIAFHVPTSKCGFTSVCLHRPWNHLFPSGVFSTGSTQRILPKQHFTLRCDKNKTKKKKTWRMN